MTGLARTASELDCLPPLSGCGIAVAQGWHTVGKGSAREKTERWRWS